MNCLNATRRPRNLFSSSFWMLKFFRIAFKHLMGKLANEGTFCLDLETWACRWS